MYNNVLELLLLFDKSFKKYKNQEMRYDKKYGCDTTTAVRNWDSVRKKKTSIFSCF